MKNFKKIILCGLACGILSGYALAEAQAPTLKINGYTIVNGLAVKQQRKDNGKGGDMHFAIGASDLYFTIAGKAESGLEYKYRINFEAIPGTAAYINKNYVEFNGGFGTVQFGNLKGPEDAMVFSGLQLAGAANSIDGSLNTVYNFSSGVINGVYFMGETNKSTKLVYYSPTVNGFQLGVAYTPNTSQWGKGDKVNNRINNYATNPGNQSAIYPDNKNNAPYGKNNVVVGLKYTKTMDKWTFGAAIVGVRESAVMAINSGSQGRTKVRNSNSYAVTANIGYDQWMFAGGWIDNRKSRLPVDQITIGSGEKAYSLGNTYKGNAGTAWNFGGNYTVGAYQFGLVYYRTDRKTDATNKANSDIVSASVDVLALQGLKFFGEVDFLRTRTNAGAIAVQQGYLDAQGKGEKAIGNNSGTVVAIGTKLSF